MTHESLIHDSAVLSQLSVWQTISHIRMYDIIIAYFQALKTINLDTVIILSNTHFYIIY